MPFLLEVLIDINVLNLYGCNQLLALWALACIDHSFLLGSDDGVELTGIPVTG
jgi:hypothetical protein